MTDLKVIGVGYARTGTFSLKTALDQIGFRCYHMYELMNRPTDASLWLRVCNGENSGRLFKQIFNGYDATVDFPSVYFYRDLLEHYPNAKVILTIRDSDSWYDSFQNTVNKVNHSVLHLTGLYIRNYKLFKVIKKTLIIPFMGHFSDRQYVMQVYEQHNADILKYVPAERLLIYRVEQGWKPLCKFLNVPCPINTPFPHVNDRQQFAEAVNRSKMVGLLAILGCVAAILFVFGLLYYWCQY